jgi:Importin-beta N-terminal domain
MSTNLPTLLLASLHPSTRKQAESALTGLSTQPGFLNALLALVLDAQAERSVRLAGCVYLKNCVKLRWEEVSVLLCLGAIDLPFGTGNQRPPRKRQVKSARIARPGYDRALLQPIGQADPGAGCRERGADSGARFSGKVDRACRCE